MVDISDVWDAVLSCCWDLCDEDGSGLVEDCLENDQGMILAPKISPCHCREDCGSVPVFGNRI